MQTAKEKLLYHPLGFASVGVGLNEDNDNKFEVPVFI